MTSVKSPIASLRTQLNIFRDWKPEEIHGFVKVHATTANCGPSCTVEECLEVSIFSLGPFVCLRACRTYFMQVLRSGGFGMVGRPGWAKKGVI